MKYFQVLVGKHQEGLTDKGVPATYFKGGPLGDVVATTTDLNQLNGQGVAPKFLELHKEDPRVVRRETAASESEIVAQEEDNETGVENPPLLDNMTKKDLIAFAEENEIPFDASFNKSELLETIEETLAQ